MVHTNTKMVIWVLLNLTVTNVNVDVSTVQKCTDMICTGDWLLLKWTDRIVHIDVRVVLTDTYTGPGCC